MKYLFLSLLVVFFASCCNQNQIKRNQVIADESQNDFMIKYRKTGCFGSCATFNLIINKDGKMLYNGLANVINIGFFESQLSKEKIKELIYIFEKNDFWNFENKYSDNITDLPTTFITFKNNNKVKEVEDYFGAPKKLKEIELLIDNIIEKSTWEKKEKGN